MKILVVEDEEKIARALQRGLEQERFSVEITLDGAAGLAAAEADAILNSARRREIMGQILRLDRGKGSRPRRINLP